MKHLVYISPAPLSRHGDSITARLDKYACLLHYKVMEYTADLDQLSAPNDFDSSSQDRLLRHGVCHTERERPEKALGPCRASSCMWSGCFWVSPVTRKELDTLRS
eukprot:2614453-Amphidinium_carterae.1